MVLNQYEKFALAHYFKSFPGYCSFTEITLAMNEYAPYTESSKEVRDQLILCEQYEFSNFPQIVKDMRLMVSVLESQFVERPPLTVEGKQLRAVFQSLGEPKNIEVMLDSSFGSDATINGVDFDSENGVQVSDEMERIRIKTALLNISRHCLNEKFPGWEGSSKVGLYFNLDGSVHIDFQWVRTEESEAIMQL